MFKFVLVTCNAKYLVTLQLKNVKWSRRACLCCTGRPFVAVSRSNPDDSRSEAHYWYWMFSLNALQLLPQSLGINIKHCAAKLSKLLTGVSSEIKYIILESRLDHEIHEFCLIRNILIFAKLQNFNFWKETGRRQLFMKAYMVKLQSYSSAQMFYWTSALFPACNYGKINRVWTEICLTAVIGGIFMNCVCFSLDSSTGLMSQFCLLLHAWLLCQSQFGKFGTEPWGHFGSDPGV